MHPLLLRPLTTAALLLGLGAAVAQTPPPETYTVTLKDHRFTPASLEVPAGQKFTLVVKNQDASAEEFESDALRREKVIPGGQEARFALGPLKAGRYPYKGEFHPQTAQGALVAK